MLRNRLLSLVVAVLCLLSVFATTACSREDGEAQDPAELGGRLWVVTKYRAPNDVLVSPIQTDQAVTQDMTIAFFTEEGRVKGSGGVNPFGGAFEAEANGSIAFDGLVATSRAGSADLASQEDNFLEDLEAASEYVVTARRLELFDDEGRAVVRFEAMDATPLENVDWTCTGFNNGSESFVSIIPGTQVTAEFDGSNLSGKASVNRYQAKYEAHGNKLSIDRSVAVTHTEGSAKEMDQEAAYLRMLSKVFAFEIEKTVLTLYDVGGGKLAQFEAAR